MNTRHTRNTSLNNPTGSPLISNDFFVADFFCQNCGQPIKIDPSLLDQPSVERGLGELGVSNTDSKSIVTTARQHPSHVGPQYSQRHHLNMDMNALNESFIMLPTNISLDPPDMNKPFASGEETRHTTQAVSVGTRDGTGEHRGNLSHRLKVANRLFNIISSHSGVDHPMCQECTDDLFSRLEKNVSDLRKERDTYAAYISSLQSEEVDKENVAEADLEALQQREKNVMETLKALLKEKLTLEASLSKVEADLKAIEEKELAYCQDMNDVDRELKDYQNQLESINLKYDQAASNLEKLNKTNVFNDAFRIWHDGPFGTINGLRMGRLPNHPVEWSEINAAMGHAILLLDTVAHCLDFTFKTYKLVPMGSFSRIEKVEGDKAVYELYGSSDITSMLFWNRRFDYALVAFLHCLQQLGDYAEKEDPRFRLPYRIQKDKIGDTLIRLQFSSDELWTKALKYTLIDLKWMLAFASSAWGRQAGATSPSASSHSPVEEHPGQGNEEAYLSNEIPDQE